MLPFFFMAQQQTMQNEAKNRYIQHIQHSVEEATYDMAYAAKYYAKEHYNEDEVYQIEVDYQEIIQAFFESFSHRNIPYERRDFPVIGILGYEGVVIYDTFHENFLPKRHYIKKFGGRTYYFTLGNEVGYIEKENLVFKQYTKINAFSTMSERDFGEMRNGIITRCTENELNRILLDHPVFQEYVVSIPYLQQEDMVTMYDLCAFTIYHDVENILFEDVTIASIKKCGINKKTEIIN